MRDEFLEPILASDREVADEVGLRPRLLDDFVGQRELKEHLDIVLEKDLFNSNSIRLELRE